MKKIPMRKCIATQVSAAKKDLIRVVRSPEGVVSIDLSGKANGRGAYLFKSLEAVELAQKKGALARALECSVDTSVYEELKRLVTK